MAIFCDKLSYDPLQFLFSFEHNRGMTWIPQNVTFLKKMYTVLFECIMPSQFTPLLFEMNAKFSKVLLSLMFVCRAPSHLLLFK